MDEREIGVIVVSADGATTRRLTRALAAGGTLASSADPRDVVARARRSGAHVVLVDLELPGSGALAVLAALRALPGTAALVCTSRAAPAALRPSLERGALGCVSVGAGPRRLALAVRAAARGEPVLSPALLRQLLCELAAGERACSIGLHGITRREREVLGLLAEGRRTAEVAADLTLSRETVRGHVKSVLRKLGVHTCAAAVARLVTERQIALGA